LCKTPLSQEFYQRVFYKAPHNTTQSNKNWGIVLHNIVTKLDDNKEKQAKKRLPPNPSAYIATSHTCTAATKLHRVPQSECFESFLSTLFPFFPSYGAPSFSVLLSSFHPSVSTLNTVQLILTSVFVFEKNTVSFPLALKIHLLFFVRSLFLPSVV
jgi:hypothetical protein